MYCPILWFYGSMYSYAISINFHHHSFNLTTTLSLIEVNQFLAHLAKGKVSFCHHLSSVVR